MSPWVMGARVHIPHENIIKSWKKQLKGGSKHCYRANSKHVYHASTTYRNDSFSFSDSTDKPTTCQQRFIQHRNQWIDQQCIHWTRN